MTIDRRSLRAVAEDRFSTREAQRSRPRLIAHSGAELAPSSADAVDVEELFWRRCALAGEALPIERVVLSMGGAPTARSLVWSCRSPTSDPWILEGMLRNGEPFSLSIALDCTTAVDWASARAFGMRLRDAIALANARDHAPESGVMPSGGAPRW